MASRKSILFITPQLPYPPVSGGVIVSHEMVRHLSRHHALHLVCICKENDPDNEAEFLGRISLAGYKSFRPDKRVYERSAGSLARSWFSGLPLSVYRNSIVKMRDYVGEVTSKTHFDYIIADHYVSFQFIEKLLAGNRAPAGTRFLLHQHNAEHVIWERYSRHERNLARRLLTRFEAHRVRSYERYICGKVDNILCLSSSDVAKLSAIGVPEQKMMLVTSIGDPSLLSMEAVDFEKTEPVLLFIGTLSWEPNVDGLAWFISGAWAALKKRFPALKFYIVGKNPPERLRKIVSSEEGVVLAGFVENLEDYYARCRVFVSPLQTGSGIKIKNINAMYRGIPLVTTPVGAEGIDGEHGVHFMVAGNMDDFRYSISRTLEDKKLWQTLATSSRKFMEDNYSRDQLSRKLDGVIK